jgi:hypothetical protein
MNYDQEHWYLSCHMVNISRKELTSESLDGAIDEAIEIMEREITYLQKAIDTVRNVPKPEEDEG